MTIKIVFERSSQKGGRQGVRKGGQQLLSRLPGKEPKTP